MALDMVDCLGWVMMPGMQDYSEGMQQQQWPLPAEVPEHHNLSRNVLLVQYVYHIVCISEVFVTKLFSYFPLEN